MRNSCFTERRACTVNTGANNIIIMYNITTLSGLICLLI
jgi:hypothetical protein